MKIKKNKNLDISLNCFSELQLSYRSQLRILVTIVPNSLDSSLQQE
jgi:hypothetical protein